MKYFVKAFFIAQIILLVGCNVQKNNSTKSLASDKDWKAILSPFMNSEIINMKKRLSDTTRFHPLDKGRGILSCLYYGKLENDSVTVEFAHHYLEYYLKYQNENILVTDSTVLFTYDFDHDEYKANEWWSSMAQSSLAVAYLWGGMEFNDPRYIAFGKKLINPVLIPTYSNGCSVALENGGKWFLEYADSSTTVKNAKFVNNGFLLALLGVKLYSELLNDEYYEKEYQSGLKGFKYLADKFLYPDSSWYYYMLNPLTIEPAHYVYYCTKLYKSLNLITKDDFFGDLFNERIELLNKQYSYDLFKDEKGQKKILYSAIGAPHPYWPDVPPINLKLYNNETLLDSTVHFFKDFKIQQEDRLFVVKDVYNSVDSISLGYYYLGEYLSSSGGKVSFSKINDEAKFLESEYKTKTLNNLTKISADSFLLEGNKGVLRFIFDEHVDMKNNKFLGINLNPSFSAKNFKLAIIDVNGNNSYRYYPVVEPNLDFLLLFNYLGFKSKKELTYDKIKEIRLEIYGNNESDEIINLNHLVLFENNLQLYKYFKTQDFKFMEKTSRGNIY